MSEDLGPACADLETGMHHWTRLVKLALGLRTPDIPGGVC